MAIRRKVHSLDPEDGTDGQGILIVDGRFVVGNLPAGFNGAAGRPPNLVPYGVKLRGANIVPMGYGSGGTSGDPWGEMFADWATAWDAVVKPQIDAAASAGANALRCIGSISGIHLGLDTPANYLAAYEQMVDYAANLGLWFYACLSDAGHWNSATADEALAIMAPVAAMLDTKPNVFAIDIAQELGLNTGITGGLSAHDFLSYMIGALRDHTTLPMTASQLGSSNSSSSMWSTAATAACDDVVDFHDFHPYYDGMARADISPALGNTDKPIILGEYGANVTKPGRYSAAADVSGLSRIVGSLAWAIADYNADGSGGAWGPTGAWGLFDYTLTERTTLTDIFKTVPDHQGTLPEAGHIVEDEAVTLPARSRVNFTGAGVTATDDATNDRTVVTIPGGGGLTIQDENANVATAVTQIDFQGAGVTATAGTGEVVVTIGGASSSSGELLMQDGVTAPPVPIENEARSDWLYQG